MSGITAIEKVPRIGEKTNRLAGDELTSGAEEGFIGFVRRRLASPCSHKPIQLAKRRFLRSSIIGLGSEPPISFRVLRHGLERSIGLPEKSSPPPQTCQNVICPAMECSSNWEPDMASTPPTRAKQKRLPAAVRRVGLLVQMKPVRAEGEDQKNL